MVNLQPLDGDLTSLAAAAATNVIYYRQGTNSWAPVTVSTGLSFVGGVLTATSVGAGDVTSSGAGFSTSTLAGYADASGDVIRAVTMPAAGLTISGSALQLTEDLAALEALSGTNTIYRRSGTNTWSAVTYSAGISLSVGGVLALDDELMAFAGLAGTPETVPYFIGPASMSSFASTSFSRSVMASANAGVYRSAIGAGDAVLAAVNTFTGALNTFTQPVGFSPIVVNTGAPLQIHRLEANADLESTNWSTNVGYLPRMHVRKSNSGVIGTNTANAAGLVGSQMGQIIFSLDNGASFTIGGMMTCTNSQPFDASYNPTRFGFYTSSPIGGDGLQERFFVDAIGRFIVGKGGAASPYLHYFQVLGLDGNTNMMVGRYSADLQPSQIYIDKSRGASIGSMVPVANGDVLGQINFRGVDSNNQHISGVIIGAACIGTPSAGVVPSQFLVNNGGTILLRADNIGGVQFKGSLAGDEPTLGFVGEYRESTGSNVTLGTAGTHNPFFNLILSAGDWDLYGKVTIVSTGTPTLLQVSISSGTTALTGTHTDAYYAQLNGAVGTGCTVLNVSRRLTVAATTSVYLVAAATGGTANTGYGNMWARRRR